MSNDQKPRPGVRFITVSADEAGQRLDNYLLRSLPGVPKTRIYRAVRKGEVRVNKSRAKAETRLDAGDQIRVPPISVTERRDAGQVPSQWAERIRRAIVLDRPELMVINKPTGLAVHGGSGVSVGLIESLRKLYPEQRYMELVHRLDRDTSGLILVAKKASVLRDLHAQLRGDKMDKRYLALVAGKWPAHTRLVNAPLEKISLKSGERMVRVAAGGRPSKTAFRVIERFPGATLIEAKPITGRTHQIRVHSLHVGHPILGDAKYRFDESDALTVSLGLKRLFLHAAALSFTVGDETISLEAPLDEELTSVCDALRSRR
ncbi:MAG: 23S rRNA pseudouridine(955/2504/2580) synthase RluC [Halieaceae bacterium]|nr:23S rRNA pseudouridine(955/2504/2580) synthase RluC [Halieaceae bacterium]